VKRLLSFTLKLAVFLALALWLADRPGTARIVWHDYLIETSAAFLVLVVVFIGFALFLLFRLWRLVKEGPHYRRLRRNLKSLQKGQQQLTEGLVAIAAGNPAEAGRYAVNARKLLGTTTATQLLQAQAAQLAEDRRAARNIYMALAAEPDSAVLGYRGLIMDAWRSSDWVEVSKLTEKLRRFKPETPWLNLIQFEISARKQHWQEASAALAKVSTAQLLDPARSKQYQAALLVAAAQSEAKQGQINKALQSAEQAVRFAPDWLPAIIALVQSQAATGHMRAASRTIEKAWSRVPNPQLVVVYRAVKNNADLLSVYKQIERLCRHNPDSSASHLVLALAALEADVWGEARRHLMALVIRKEATQSSYRLLARLERRESGNEQAALQWLMKAGEAPLDPQWLCRTCGGGHEEWQPLCAHCGAFNCLEWQIPGQARPGHGVQTATLAAWTD